LLLAVGEVVPPCGRCDRCLARPQRRDWAEQAGELLALLGERGGRDLRSLAGDLAARHGSEEERWAWLARRLVQEELLSESDDGAQRLWLRSSGQRWLRTPWPLHWAA
jgi:ATP-dependent DNA helicase RecQ